MGDTLVDIKRKLSVVSGLKETTGISSFYIDELGEHRVIVILGEPGIGKSTILKQAATKDKNGLFLTIRAFLVRSLVELEGKNLYLDALDEARPDKRNVDKIDQVVKRLNELGKPNVCISCREFDWFGDSDLSLLRDHCRSDEQPLVLHVEDLSKDDVREIAAVNGITNPDDFWAKADSLNLADLLSNPATLLLLIEVAKKGTWPEDRFSLLEMACSLLIIEKNSIHSGYNDAYSREELIKAAGEICAAILLTGEEGVSLSPEQSGLSLNDLDSEDVTLQTVARRRLFCARETDKAVPIHRIVAEHLAAGYLSGCILSGKVPVSRILAMMTAEDGAPAVDLRGVFASLATRNNTLADLLLYRDPLGIIFYGNVNGLSLDVKRKLLQSIVSLADRDPYFRSRSLDSNIPFKFISLFGQLADPGLEDDLKTILEDEKYKKENHLITTICNIVEFGERIDGLKPNLLNIIKDAERDEWQRAEALDALLSKFPEATDDFRALLSDLDEYEDGTKHRELRSRLLRLLYPDHLSLEELFPLLIEVDEGLIGDYWQFLYYDLAVLIPEKDLTKALDKTTIMLEPIKNGIELSSYFRLHCSLLSRWFVSAQSYITGENIFRYTSPFEHCYGQGERESTTKIKDFFMQHEDVVLSLYEYALREKTDLIDRYFFHITLRRQTFDSPIPSEASSILLDVLSGLEDQEKAAELLDLVFWHTRNDAAYWDNKLHQVVSGKKTLEAKLQKLFTPPKISEAEKRFQEQDEKWKKESQQRKRKAEGIRKKNIAGVLENKDAVCSGAHAGFLCFIGQVAWGIYRDTRGETPEERLRLYFGDELLANMLTALKNCVLRYEKPFPHQIVSIADREKEYPIGYPVTLGMDLLFEENPSQILSLSNRTLSAALCFHNALPIEPEGGIGKGVNKKAWADFLAKAKPELTQHTYLMLLNHKLKKDAEHISMLYDFPRDEALSGISKDIAIRLLKKYPCCQVNPLSDLLKCVLRYATASEFHDLYTTVKHQIEKDGGIKQLIWATVGLFYAPQKGIFFASIPIDDATRWELAKFAKKLLAFARDINQPIPHTLYEQFIRLCGSVFPPASMPTGGWSGEDAPWDKSRFVSNMIQELAQDVNDGASDALSRFSVDPSLSAWNELIRHQLSNQIRRRAEARFVRMSPSSIMEVLRNKSPGNADDLMALVLDHLQDLQDETRNGPLDGWKAYWNTSGSHSDPTTPKPENDCRDRLVERLKDKVLAQGVAVSTETRSSNEKRIDIKARCLGDNFIPIEVKLQKNRELWTAPKEQLYDRYMSDNKCSGHGIYLAFWHGQDLPTCAYPDRQACISNAKELKALLEAHIRKQGLGGIEVFVFDVSKK
ncbi:MAG: ATP-binding protein [Alphaproteobacteria bacterium]|nr:ATP-binding protein [Alphaproteobacteria bacterium]